MKIFCSTLCGQDKRKFLKEMVIVNLWASLQPILATGKLMTTNVTIDSPGGLLISFSVLRLYWQCSHLDWLKMEEECSIHVHRLRDPSMYSNQAYRLACVLRSRELRGGSWKKKCLMIGWKRKSRYLFLHFSCLCWKLDSTELCTQGNSVRCIMSPLPAVEIVDCTLVLVTRAY